MVRIFKALVVLAVIGFVGLTGYAYLVEFAPEQGEVTLPVVLDAN